MPRWVAEEKKKKKDKEKTGSPKSQSSSVKNVNKKASKSTFMGGTNTEEQKPKTVKRQPSAKAQQVANEMRTRNSNTTAAQRQKMGMQTQADEQAARESRRELGNSIKTSVKKSMSEDNRSFAQRQKSGTLTAQDEERVKKTSERRKEVARNTGAVAKKAVMDTVSGYGQSLADVDEMAKSNRNWTTAKAQKMGIDLNDKARVSKVEQERQQSIREAREFRQELFDKQEQRQAEWDERTKNAKGLEKAWYGAVESGTGMLADTAIGAATGTGQFGALASMGLRTYGPSTMQARKEGATDKEARLYGLATSAKEMGTELMFQGAGLAKAAYGKTGLSLADKSANILTKGLTGLKADVVGAGVRALGGTAEENVEELAGWMADPLIKELTYGKNVRNRMRENLRANIPQIGSDADAANVASYFSTPQFTDDLTKEYVKSGLSKDRASELAAEMRDYYIAYYSGDSEKLDALESDLAAKLSGQDKLSLRSWSMDELKDTFASTTLLTLATGIPGAVNTSVKGNQIFDSDEVKAVFGDDAVRKVADAVKNTSDKEMSLKAETMKDRLDSGKDLTGTQKYDLYQGYLEKVNETSKKARASYGVVENAREEQDLVPTMGVDRTGNTVYAKATQREYNEKFASTELTVEALKNYMESDNSISDDESRRANAVKKAVADIHVGGLTVGDAHEFAYGNTLAREALKAEEGIDLDRYIVRNTDGTVDLSATNEATENALFQINADNAIRAAQAETEVFIDDTRGSIDRDVMSRFGNNGQAIWKEVNKDLDPRDLQNYLTTANAASYFYSAGRNTDMGVDTAINRYADTFKTVDNSVLKRAFAAGARDRIIANTPGYGQTVTSGSNISLKKTKPIITGQLIMDKDVVIPDSDQSAYLALAMSTNTNIHIVSSLKSKQGVEINGMSHGNDIYLNMNAAAESNLGYVFMHEMTHQVKQYAPNEYLALENLVRDRWFNKDQKGMQKAIKDRIDLYSTKGGQQLTEEEAVEEIIADAMAEAMDDPDFAAQVCEEDINLGQAILNSIREALRSIRNMFASTEFKNDRFHNSLLSYLGILDEAEKMWLNALATARKNKANGLIADWQDRANKQNSPRLSVGEGKYSITTDKDDFIKGANLSKDLRDWAKEMGLDKLSKQPIKGPVIVSVRDLRTAWYEKNGRADEANVINTALDKIGDSLTQLVGKYQYIDLGDALNAAVTYRTDAEGHPTSVILSCQVKNAEYEVNFDFTTICAKRLAMQKILEKFIKTEGERQGTTLYDELKLDEEGLYKLRLILETAGFEVSCRGCFVEQNRYSQQNQARTIANDWNAALDDWARENGTEVTENFGLTTLDINNLDYEEIEAGFERYHELMKGKKTDVATKNRMLIEASPFFRKRMNASDYASMAGQRALMAIGESKKGGTNLYGLLKRGQSDSKQSVPFTAYNGEIALLPDNMKGKSLYDYLLSIGGARAQSASDFQIEFVYDYMQMVADLSARGLPMHMYTKVIELAELFGMTGIKINLSAMCDVAEDVGGEYAGLKLVDGKYEYNISDQSIDYEKAVELQKRDGYSKNIGIIMVTLSSQHMLKSLDDPDVRYIIGYHSSAMPVVVANMSNMGGATDYTKINKTNKLNEKGQALFDEAMEEAKGNTELEKYKDALRIFDEKIQAETAKKKKKPRRGNEYGAYMSAYGNNTADFNTYDSLLDTKDARKTADKYLEHCMENDLIPIYFPFAFHENYYKCEVYDFNMYDNNTGEYAPMESVQNIYPGLNMAAGETDTTAFTERVSQMMDERNRLNESLDSQYDAVFDEAKKELKYSITGDDYMDIDASGIDHSELVHRADAPKTEAQMRDDDYMAAVNSGNMEEAQRLVDEAAKTAMPNTKLKGRWYHGTENEFTEFNFSQGGKNGTADGFGIYLTNDPEVASSYGNRMIEGYVNVERPASALTTVTLTKPELHRLIRRTVEIEAETLQYDGYDSLEDAKRDTWISNYVNTYSAKNLEDAIADVTDSILQFNGNDMDIIQEIMVGMGIRDYDSAMDFYDMLTEETGIDGFETKWGDESEMADPNTPTIALAFRSNQIKSADTVTYAEDGSVIPLSERFDPTNNDIRYSLPTQDSDGKILTDGQMEFFKNSQARDIFGKLVPVYHATSMGGFTIFNPEYSNDKRSLFFSSKWQVAQTYAANAENRISYDSREISSWNDLVNYAKELAESAGTEWEPDEEAESLGWAIRRKDNDNYAHFEIADSFDEAYETWLQMVEDNDPRLDDYKVQIELHYAEGEDIMTQEIEGDNYESLLENVSNASIPKPGYYAVYLNLENPLIIYGHGQPWNDIVDGGSVFPAFSYVRVKDAEWYREDADNADEMYAVGQRLYNGDDSRAKAEELSTSGLVEIEIFDGEKKHKATISHDADSIGQEIANVFGIDDMEMVSGIAEEMALDMEVSNSTRFDATDMRNTIGEYGYSTREWAEFAEDEGYDGVIIRNIVDIDDKTEIDEEDAASDIYIAFSSNQVKDTRNENPTENPDIRYSITEEDEAMEWLASQYELDDVPLEDEQAEEGRVRMAKSKNEFIRSKNALWNERWLTEGKVLNVKSTRKSIKDLVMGAMANSDTDHKYKSDVVDKTLIDAKSAYWLMKEGKHSEAAELLWNSAVKMIENVDFIEDTTFKQYKELRDYMRTTSFKLGEEYWSDVDFSAFRKRNFGRIKLVKGETNIDEIYKELQKKWGEWFDEDEQMTAPDQLLHIEEVLDAIQPYKIAYSSEEAEQLAGDIADALYDIVYQGEAYKSIADTYKERYDAKTKALKARHKEALAKVRKGRDLKLRKEKAKFKEYKEKKKNAKEKAKHFGRIADNIDWLTTRLLNETKDKNIPEGFRRTLAHMLMQFDMQTERSKALEEKYGSAKKTLQMRELKNRLEKIANEDDTGEFRYDGYLFYLMDALAEKADGKSIDSLDTEDLIAIDTMLKSIVHNFRNYNKIRLEEEKVAIANVGDSIIEAMDERIKKYGKRKSYKGARGLLDKLVNEGEETPIYFFERLDPTGNGIGAMYNELRRGEDRHIRNMNFLRNRFKEMFSDYANEKKAGSKLEEWRDTSQAQTFNLENGSITLNPAQIMSLYCLSKRTQAMGHILGAGIVASPISFGAKMREKFKGNEEQVDSVMIKYSEVQEIIATLTEDQMKLADEMQALMNNEMAAWGNETSLELHGIKLFRETDYFPIKSSNEVLEKPAEKRDVQEKIKNFGFTKPLTRNANNAIMIDDIFSVVADHCNKMSLYNSMAIPITDFMRVYNYKQKLDSGRQRTVQTVIGEAFTRKANDYIMKFIADVNGNTKTRSDAVDDLMNKTLANYKKASIGFNARVALQQPTAVFRALMAIDAKYFAGTRLVSPKDQKEMFEHCPIALWKSWGHYDMDMGRDIEDIMMNNDHSLFDTVTMGGYRMLDNMAWGKIWQAVKNEIKDKHPDVKVGSPAFYRLCNERASEVFDKTQVVDSIFHRSDIMRSKNTLTKMTTSFMAEPTLTYNVFRDSLVKAHELRKDGNKGEASKLLLKMGIVTTLNALAVSGAAALWDAVRGKGADDDDDDESFVEKGLMKLVTALGGTDPWTKEQKNGKDLWLINFLNNFVDNAPWAQWNNIYFVKDIVGLKDGWGTSNMALEGWETLFKGFSQAHKKITEGSDKSWYDIFMNIAGGTGYLIGWPIKTFLRDAKALAEKAGVEVFAADDTDSETSLIDNIAEKMGYQKAGSTDNVASETTSKESKPDKKQAKKAKAEHDQKLSDYRESLSDNLSEDQKNKLVKKYEKSLEGQEAAEEAASEGFDVQAHIKEAQANFEFEMEKRSLKAAENAAGKTGDAKNSALWDVIADGYSKSVESGNMATIQAMKDVFVENGGDADWFDAKITDKMKSKYKTTIGDTSPGASLRQETMRNYMIEHGVSEAEISEIVRKSASARDLKAAMRLGNEEYIIDELVPLIRAGLTREDYEYLYKYRNYGAKDYNGKYTDPKYTKTTGTFIWPTDGVITSHFGYRNDVGSVGGSRNHPAIDIGAPKGTPVVAADGGVVFFAGSNGGYGNSVGVRHANGMVTYYNHLSAWNVKVGDQVGQGQQIAQVGSTGRSTGPHLDFKILDVDGNPVDPEKYLNQRS